MTTPDPTDLRLVSALAELGRTTVYTIAARAGVGPEEAAVRLLRMGLAGMPLVVGAEGDRAGLQAWLGAQSPRAQPPQPPPVPYQPAPERRGAPQIGWGVSQSASWTRQDPQQSGPAGPTVGDTLTAVSPTGEQVAITLVEVVDTADALIAAAGHPLAPGTRATVVHTEIAAGPSGYQAIPDTCLCVVLTDGTEVGKSGIALSSRPPFRSGIAPQDTIGGHTVFELDSQASIVGIRWRPVPGAPALDWRTR